MCLCYKPVSMLYTCVYVIYTCLCYKPVSMLYACVYAIYICQCYIHVSMLYTCVNSIYMCQCYILVSMLYTCVNAIYLCKCYILVSMLYTCVNVIYLCQCYIPVSLLYNFVNDIYFVSVSIIAPSPCMITGGSRLPVAGIRRLLMSLHVSVSPGRAFLSPSLIQLTDPQRPLQYIIQSNHSSCVFVCFLFPRQTIECFITAHAWAPLVRRQVGGY